jgi:hypothetical protein
MAQGASSREFIHKCYLYCYKPINGTHVVINKISIRHSVDGVLRTRIAGQTFDALTIDRHTGEILFVHEPRGGLETIIYKKTGVHSPLTEVTISHDVTGVRSLIPCRRVDNETEFYIISHRNANNSCISLFSIGSSRCPTVTIHPVIYELRTEM